jgi:transcriptional regulator with XRE-family HTH domain
MHTRIREVRKAKKLTLLDVAERCAPPTTAQTIGRLETGMRTVSVGWLNRIAKALGVEPSELVSLPGRIDVPVVAQLGPDGPLPPPMQTVLMPPAGDANMLGLTVVTGQGDYRTGDQLWLERLDAADAALALNRDVLVPRGTGRYAFGRMIGHAPDGTGVRVQLLPFHAGARQLVVAACPWVAVARTLVRGV